jgi:tetratricopeptide (TPR) repeat protein
MVDSPRIAELQRRLLADPGSVAFAALAEEYRRAGRPSEAVETCRAGLRRHPSYVSAHVTLGRALADLGRRADACAELEQALRLAPEHLVAARTLGDILRNQGRRAEALERYRQALAMAPGDADLRAAVAALATERDDTPSAVTPEAPAASAPALARLEGFLAAIRRRRAQVEQGPSGAR